MPALENASLFLGKSYSKLTILSDLGTVDKCRRVEAKCECGNIKAYRLSDIKNGGSTNCGCVRNMANHSRSTHGDSHTNLYKVWRGIKERCYYAKHVKYSRYGGRGISVCDEWINSFQIFKKWALINGYEQGLEIDRKDNDGNYSPDNCRWVTITVNRRNKSNARILTLNGESRCMAEWAEITGINQGAIKDRLNKLKWSIEKALTTPIKTLYAY